MTSQHKASIKLYILSRDGFVAFDSLQSERVINARIVNLAFAFCLTYFAQSSNLCLSLRHACEILTAVVSESQRGPHSFML